MRKLFLLFEILLATVVAAETIVDQNAVNDKAALNQFASDFPSMVPSMNSSSIVGDESGVDEKEEDKKTAKREKTKAAAKEARGSKDKIIDSILADISDRKRGGRRFDRPAVVGKRQSKNKSHIDRLLQADEVDLTDSPSSVPSSDVRLGLDMEEVQELLNDFVQVVVSIGVTRQSHRRSDRISDRQEFLDAIFPRISRILTPIIDLIIASLQNRQSSVEQDDDENELISEWIDFLSSLRENDTPADSGALQPNEQSNNNNRLLRQHFTILPPSSVPSVSSVPSLAPAAGRAGMDAAVDVSDAPSDVPSSVPSIAPTTAARIGFDLDIEDVKDLVNDFVEFVVSNRKSDRQELLKAILATRRDPTSVHEDDESELLSELINFLSSLRNNEAPAGDALQPNEQSNDYQLLQADEVNVSDFPSSVPSAAPTSLRGGLELDLEELEELVNGLIHFAVGRAKRRRRRSNRKSNRQETVLVPSLAPSSEPSAVPTGSPMSNSTARPAGELDVEDVEELINDFVHFVVSVRRRRRRRSYRRPDRNELLAEQSPEPSASPIESRASILENSQDIIDQVIAALQNKQSYVEHDSSLSNLLSSLDFEEVGELLNDFHSNRKSDRQVLLKANLATRRNPTSAQNGSPSSNLSPSQEEIIDFIISTVKNRQSPDEQDQDSSSPAKLSHDDVNEILSELIDFLSSRREIDTPDDFGALRPNKQSNNNRLLRNHFTISQRPSSGPSVSSVPSLAPAVGRAGLDAVDVSDAPSDVPSSVPSRAPSAARAGFDLDIEDVKELVNVFIQFLEDSDLDDVDFEKIYFEVVEFLFHSWRRNNRRSDRQEVIQEIQDILESTASPSLAPSAYPSVLPRKSPSDIGGRIINRIENRGNRRLPKTLKVDTRLDKHRGVSGTQLSPLELPSDESNDGDRLGEKRKKSQHRQSDVSSSDSNVSAAAISKRRSNKEDRPKREFGTSPSLSPIDVRSSSTEDDVKDTDTEMDAKGESGSVEESDLDTPQEEATSGLDSLNELSSDSPSMSPIDVRSSSTEDDVKDTDTEMDAKGESGSVEESDLDSPQEEATSGLDSLNELPSDSPSQSPTGTRSALTTTDKDVATDTMMDSKGESGSMEESDHDTAQKEPNSESSDDSTGIAAMTGVAAAILVSATAIFYGTRRIVNCKRQHEASESTSDRQDSLASLEHLGEPVASIDARSSFE